MLYVCTICIYVCMYVCMYVCTYENTVFIYGAYEIDCEWNLKRNSYYTVYIGAHTYIHAHTYTHTYTRTHTYTHTNTTHTHMHTHTQIQHTHTHKYNTHTHTHTHTHIHTYIQAYLSILSISPPGGNHRCRGQLVVRDAASESHEIRQREVQHTLQCDGDGDQHDVQDVTGYALT